MAANAGDCAILASAGRGEMGVAAHLIVTHGRGNPEQLGNPPGAVSMSQASHSSVDGPQGRA